MAGVAVLRMLSASFASALVLAAPAAGAAPMAPVDDRFQDQVVLENLQSPMAVRFAPPPDGRIFVAEKSGRIRVYRDRSDQHPQVTVDLADEVHDFWDRGLLGMALDPAFVLNGRLYVLYTRDAAIGGPAPRWGDTCPNPPGALAAGCVVSAALARITVNELGVATETTTLIKDEWCQQFPSHSIGTVAFGPDGMLYAGAGEGASFSQRDWGQLPGLEGYPSNPCGDPPDEGGSMRSQDVRTAADPTGLSGAIIRVDPATGEGAPGNPFASGDAGARRLIAYGLRNPFRWAFRPGTNEIWIGDVGAGRWEEIDVVGDATDAAAENFGWPCFEGSGRQGGWDLPQCQNLSSTVVTPPRFQYEHWREIVAGDGCRWQQGSALSGIAFPSGYEDDRAGNLFFADYAGVCIFAMRPGSDGRPDPSTVSVFARGSGSGGPVELQDGPGGDLYYTYYDPERPGQGSVHRIRYTPGNRAPEPIVSASPVEGPAPLDVTFSAAGTTDPDADELQYDWDLDGDGAFDDARGQQATRTYTRPGTVRAGVRVSDPYGQAADAFVTVSVGNTAPRAVIEAPADGEQWSVGEAVAFRGSATDDQEALGPGALEWVLTLDHCPQSVAGCHAHPIERATGAAGSIVGPEHEYPSRLVLTLIATDSGGLTGTSSVRLDPRAAHVRVTSGTPGTTVSLDGVEGSEVQRTVIAGSRVTVASEPEQQVGSSLWRFRSWSDGAFSPTRVLTPAGDVALTAAFSAVPAASPSPSPSPARSPAPGATPEPEVTPQPVRDARSAVLRVSVDRARRPRLIARRTRLSVRCSRTCSLRAGAWLVVGRARHRLPVPKSVSRARVGRLVLRLPRRLRATARRDLRRGRKVHVRLRLTGRASGSVRRRTVKVPLRLG